MGTRVPASRSSQHVNDNGELIDVYFQDKQNELKERSIKNKRYMIESHLLPYFKDKPMDEVVPADIIKWQNEIISKGYSETYLRMIQNQLTALFTHAQQIYDLKRNPCKKVKKMGKADASRIDFWTLDEYNQFISVVDCKDKYHVVFQILFWTGCREGELLALTKDDIDVINNKIRINKTYYRTGREDVITSPKTESSERVIAIPEFLTKEIVNHMNRIYDLQNDERLFPVVAEAVQKKMKRTCIKAGVKHIRVHDLRHSHVAYLIDKKVDPLIIKERLGHSNIKITLDTYGHLYPTRQREVADMLQQEYAEINKIAFDV